ncbi:MAG: hypothetical protein ACRCSU_12695 [Paracoccaceae bacterium]
MMQIQKATGLALCVALAGLTPMTPAQAAGFRAPEGCEAFLTVQSRACRVSNHYRCTAQPGDQWRADFDQEGVFFVSRINREGEWVESLEFNPDVRQTLDPAPTDAASFSDLLAKGRDDFSFGLSRDDGQSSQVTGHDKLTGKTMVIDGVELQQTEFEFTETAPDGTVQRQSRGNEYVSGELRLFFAGPSEFWDGEGWLPMDGSPVQFIRPGEPGFGATQPIFDCGSLMSEAPLDRLLQQVRHER